MAKSPDPGGFQPIEVPVTDQTALPGFQPIQVHPAGLEQPTAPAPAPTRVPKKRSRSGAHPGSRTTRTPQPTAAAAAETTAAPVEKQES